MRYIIIHSLESVIRHEERGKAHCFGPFDSFEDAQKFSDESVDDDCYKWALPLVGPDDKDLLNSILEEALENGVKH